MLLQCSRRLSTAFCAARRPLISHARRHASSGGASSDSGATVQRLGLPDSASKRILLHSCCAPCSGAMVQEMVEAGHDISIFFYNPNIHPKREYEIRKEENKRYAADLGIPFVDADYDTEEWYRRARGMEFDPERGGRCSMCFDMRMERTALHAYEHGFDCFTTTNATSRWKDQQQVNKSGLKAAARYDFTPYYWVYDWQTDAMTRRKYEINAGMRFYKQEYCGCSFSLRDNNLYRKQHGQPPVRIGGEEAGVGSRYYVDPEADAAEESQDEVDAFFASAVAEIPFDSAKVLQGRRRSDGPDAANEKTNNW